MPPKKVTEPQPVPVLDELQRTRIAAAKAAREIMDRRTETEIENLEAVAAGQIPRSDLREVVRAVSSYEIAMLAHWIVTGEYLDVGTDDDDDDDEPQPWQEANSSAIIDEIHNPYTRNAFTAFNPYGGRLPGPFPAPPDLSNLPAAGAAMDALRREWMEKNLDEGEPDGTQT